MEFVRWKIIVFLAFPAKFNLCPMYPRFLDKFDFQYWQYHDRYWLIFLVTFTPWELVQLNDKIMFPLQPDKLLESCLWTQINLINQKSHFRNAFASKECEISKEALAQVRVAIGGYLWPIAGTYLDIEAHIWISTDATERYLQPGTKHLSQWWSPSEIYFFLNPFMDQATYFLLHAALWGPNKVLAGVWRL